MARLANALRLALGGATGALEGYGAKQERLRKEEETRRQVERQTLMDALTTAQALKGLDFETMGPGALPAPASQVPGRMAAPPMSMPSSSDLLSRAIQTGMGVEDGKPSMGTLRAGSVLPSLETKPLRPMARPTPSAPAPDTQVTIPGFGAIGFRRVSEEERQQRKIRGLEQEERVKSTIATEEKNQRIQNLVEAGYTRADAIKRVELDAKYADVEMTPSVATVRRGQDIDAQIAREKIALDRDRMKAEGQPGGRSAEAKAALQTMLPTIRANNQRLQEMTPQYVNKLSGLKVMAAAKAPLLANRDDVLGFIGGSLANMASDPEAREYASIARAVTDAVARASEVGVLTNQDIARYQGQILFMPGDTKADRLRKFNTLKSWAGWLDNNQGALISGAPTQVTAAPDDLMADYPQAGKFIQAAREQGESEMAIRRLLEANQGRRR